MAGGTASHEWGTEGEGFWFQSAVTEGWADTKPVEFGTTTTTTTSTMWLKISDGLKSLPHAPGVRGV